MISRSRILAFVVCLALTAALTPSFGATYRFSTLVSFDGTNGYDPEWLTMDSSGNLFGTAGNFVYEVAAGTNTLTTLASADFGGVGVTGFVRDSFGNIYGTTFNGGAKGQGSVFQVAAGTHAVTTLFEFNGINGRDARGLVIDSSGNLYGLAKGGAANGGIVFKIDTGTHAFSTIAAFDATAELFPTGRMIAIDSAGNIYGTVSFVEEEGVYSNVFKVAAGTNALTMLSSLKAFGDDRLDFSGVTLGDDNTLYSKSFGGPDDQGSWFSISTTTGELHSFATFYYSNFSPIGLPIVDSDGNLIGIGPGFGQDIYGRIFQYSPSDHSFDPIYTFTDGSLPFGNLVMDAQGNIYGMTQDGGLYNQGSIFKLTVVPEASSVLLSFGVVVLFAGLIIQRRFRGQAC